MNQGSKYLIFIVLTVLIVASIAGVTLYSSNVLAEASSSDDTASEYKGVKYNVRIFNGTITSITNSNITIESDVFSGTLSTNGGWIYIDSELIKRGDWSSVYGQLSEGDAFIAMLSIEKGDRSLNILLGLKQNDILVFRARVLNRYTSRWMHTRNYFGIYGKIVYKGENYMAINKHGHNILVIVGQETEWYKAGYGVVKWSDVRDEFNEGDTVRIFYHNILILNNRLAEYLGFKAIIWGYSGSIIDLDSGTALMRYLG